MPGRRQSIIWTNAGILLIGPLGTNFGEILIEIHIFSVQKMHLKMSSGKWLPFSRPRCVIMSISSSFAWVMNHHLFSTDSASIDYFKWVRLNISSYHIHSGLNSMRLCDAYMRQWISSPCVHKVVCRLFPTKPSFDLNYTPCQETCHDSSPYKLSSCGHVLWQPSIT